MWDQRATALVSRESQMVAEQGHLCTYVVNSKEGIQFGEGRGEVLLMASWESLATRWASGLGGAWIVVRKERKQVGKREQEDRETRDWCSGLARR